MRCDIAFIMTLISNDLSVYNPIKICHDTFDLLRVKINEIEHFQYNYSAIKVNESIIEVIWILSCIDRRGWRCSSAVDINLQPT